MCTFTEKPNKYQFLGMKFSSLALWSGKNFPKWFFVKRLIFLFKENRFSIVNTIIKTKNGQRKSNQVEFILYKSLKPNSL